MARFWTEPAYEHGTVPRVGVLLVNLGTPEAPTARALRPYLKQFLSDPRVVEIPRLVWWPILNGIILNTRPAKSAAKYASVWMQEGSPLKVHTERQAKLLAEALMQDDGPNVEFAWAMRYGAPSIPDMLNALRAKGCNRILVLPAYPQYSSSTTGSVMDEVAHCLRHWRNQPEIRYLRSFHDDRGYIGALAQSVRDHWIRHGEPEKLLLSFHGVPRRTLELGDPYHCECHKTARLVTEALRLPPDRALVTFQSRFGKAEWLQPYTQPTLEALARAGTRRVDVICPGFVSDCLETLEEIGMECRDAFLSQGGESFHYIACLNERSDWIMALASLVRRNTDNWLSEPLREDNDPSRSRQRAQALGAVR